MYSRSRTRADPPALELGLDPEGAEVVMRAVGVALAPVVEPARGPDRRARPGDRERRERADDVDRPRPAAAAHEVVGGGDDPPVEPGDQRALVGGEPVQAGEQAVGVAVAAIGVVADHRVGERARAHRPRGDGDRLGDLVRPGVADLDPLEVDRAAHPSAPSPIRRAIQRAPTVSVRPWATIEARITNEATSKTSVPCVDRRVEDEQREQHRGDPLGPEPGDERLVRPRDGRCPRSASSTATGRATSSAKTMNATSASDRAVVAGGDDQGAEDEEGEHLEDRADVLGEVGEALGDLVLGDAERDPEDEGGDQAVAEGDVGEPEGGEPEADRVDPLVARR